MRDECIQGSLLENTPGVSVPSPFTSPETFFDFVRTVTVWEEDARIMGDLNAASISEDVCTMLKIKDGKAFSVFFFGKKAFEISIAKNTGGLRLLLTADTPTDAIDDYVIDDRKHTVEFTTLSSISAVEGWLKSLKASIFRKLTTDTIGCCDKYIQCSDELACVCPRKLFSVKCLYRVNLENGRVFYGKNKTISPNKENSSQIDTANTVQNAIVSYGSAFCTLDVELANNTDKGSICSIGIVVVKNGEITDTFYSLVKPQTAFSPMCMRIHHIAPEDVACAPTFAEIWEDIRGLLTVGPVIAYHAETDIYALEKALYDADIKIPPLRYTCALRMAKALLTLDSYKLSSVCDHFGIFIENAHNALDDAKATARVVIEYMRRANVATLNALMRACCMTYEYIDTNSYDPATDTCDKKILEYIPPSVLPHKDNQFFSGKSVVLTGSFVTAPRESIRMTIEAMGGICKSAPSKKTDIVLFGFYDMTTLREGMHIGAKLQTAYDLVAAGYDIMILDENEFVEILQSDPT